jgi:hypothetical protein
MPHTEVFGEDDPGAAETGTAAVETTSGRAESGS